MAGADKLTGKIREEARQKAQANIKRSEKEAEEVLQSAREEAEKQRKDILDAALRTAEDSRKRIIALAELEGRKKRLQARQEVLEEVFRNAMSALESLPAGQYEEMLTELVLDSFRAGTAEIVLSEKDRVRLGEKFVTNVNRRLAAEGRAGSLRLSRETASINGGFILKSGNTEVNQSFDTIFKTRRDELEEPVVKVLF